MTPSTRTFYLETLGCKLNFAESATISRKIEEVGFQLVGQNQKADYYIINTCSVTENADSKCKKYIRDFKKINGDSKIIIIGCYAQLKANEIAQIEGVSLVVGANDKFNLDQFLIQLDHQDAKLGYKQAPIEIKSYPIQDIQDFWPSYSLGERTRSFLKVQDGCSYSCSFCTIPLARGQSRNGSIQSIVENAKMLGEKGIKEIVLTGVNIGDFGKSTEESFVDLIRALDEIHTIERFRISSIEPNLLTSEIIDFVASSKKFMPHFHIPLQSGSDRILGLMKRRYQTGFYRNKIEEILKKIPEAGIGVDIIVGFPGEEEKEFEETNSLLSTLDISYLHVFTYSERKDTIAINLPKKVNERDKRNRSTILHNLSTYKSQVFIEKNLNKTYPVLVEKTPINERMSGFTPNYIKLDLDFNREWINRIIPIKLNRKNFSELNLIQKSNS